MLSPALLALRQTLTANQDMLRLRGQNPSELSEKLLKELALLDRHLDLNGFLQHLVANAVISDFPPGPIVVGPDERCFFCSCHTGSCL